MPSLKAPPGSLAAYISTTSVESDLGLAAELHPEIVEFGRIDIHKTAADSYGVLAVSGLERCNPIRYVFEGKVKWYLPDLGGWTAAGELVIGEAGVLKHKSSDETRAALAAAREYVGPRGKVIVVLKGDVPRRWRVRALWLHLWRFAYFGPDELLADVAAAWQVQNRSARSLAEEFAHRAPLQVVRHAIMKTAGDALARGQLAVDLTRDDFNVDTTTRIATERSPRLPPGIRHELPRDGAIETREADDEDGPGYLQEEMLDPADAADLRRMREIMWSIEGGTPASHFAPELGCTPRWVQALHRNWVDHRHDDRVLIPHASRGDRHHSRLHPALQKRIERLLWKHKGLTPGLVRSDEKLRKICVDLGIPIPRDGQIRHFMHLLEGRIPGLGRPSVGRARPSTAHVRGYAVIYGNRPAYYTEVDEEKSNLFAQLLPGHPAADRFRRVVLRCVGTSAPLGLVGAMKATDQADLRRLILRSARSKDDLAAKAGAQHAWGIVCWPMVVVLDNAWANTARMIIRRLPAEGIYLEYAPAQRPEGKPKVESRIGRDQKLHEDRLPNSAQRHPSLRGDSDPARYAVEHAITPESIEDDFILMAVDGDLYGPTKRDETPPIRLWETGDAKYWHRTHEGDFGLLVRSLKTPVGKGTVSGGSISYKNREYVEDWAGDPRDDPRNELPYPTRRRGFLRNTAVLEKWIDNGDLRMMDVYDGAAYLGTLVCNHLALRYTGPVSALRLALEKELNQEVHEDAQASLAGAQVKVEARTRAKPRVRVAGKISAIRAVEDRHLELLRTAGGSLEQPRERDLQPATPFIPGRRTYRPAPILEEEQA